MSKANDEPMSTSTRKVRLFLSYSRAEREFAQALRDRLIGEGFDAYLDLHDIVKGEPWQERLRGLIQSADSMLFLISPTSVSSEFCDWEVNEAEFLGKRILPVVVVATPDDMVPARLKRLNYTFLDDASTDAAEFFKLTEALRANATWEREQTRLLELTLRWNTANRPMRQLLRGLDVDAAEAWRDQPAPDAPALPPLITLYIGESRRHASRVLRYWIVGLGLAVVLVAALGVIAFAQRNAAQSNELALRSDAIRATQPEAALAAAVSSYEKRSSPVALTAIRRSIDQVIARRIRRGAQQFEVTGRGHSAIWAKSRDRSHIVIGDSANGLRVLDAESLDDVARLQSAGAGITDIAIGAKGHFVAATNGSHQVLVWKVAKDGKPSVITASNDIDRVRFGRAEKIVVLIGQDVISFYALGSLKHLTTIRRSMGFGDAVDCSPDDSRCVVVGRNNQAWIVDPESGAEAAALDLQAEAAEIKPFLGGSDASVLEGAYFLDDGRRVLTTGNHAFWTLWDASTGKVLGRARSAITGIGSDWALIAADTDTVVTNDGTGGDIRTWQLDQGAVSTMSRSGHHGLIRLAALSGDGRTIATIGDDQDLIVWNLGDLNRLATWRVSQRNIVDATFTASGKSLVTLNSDGDLTLWAIEAFQSRGNLLSSNSERGVSFYSVQLRGDGRRMVAHDDKSGIGIWDVNEMKRLTRLSVAEETIEAATISADGSLVATAGRDTVHVWDTRSAQEISSLPGSFKYVAFDSTGSTVAASDFEGHVKIFAVGDKRLISEAHFAQELTNAVEFSPDARLYVVTGNDGTAILATTSTGREVTRVQTAGIPLRRATFSADGKRLFTTHDDNVLRAWDLATRGQVSQMAGHAGYVPRVRALAHGSVLLSPSNDSSVRLWNTDDGSLLRVFSGHSEPVMDAVLVDGFVVSVDRSARVLRQRCEACMNETELLMSARAKLQAIGLSPP